MLLLQIHPTDSAEIVLITTVANLSHEGRANEASETREPNDDEQTICFSVRVTRKQFEHLCAPMLQRCRTVSRAVLADCGGLAKAQIDDVVLVGGSTQVPAVRAVIKEVFEREELCVSVRGDRAVAEGAAIQGAILGGADRFHLSKVRSFWSFVFVCLFAGCLVDSVH
jgi:molecular chaperone DnaK (HSP70)